MKLRHLLIVATALALSSVASAQYLGSNDFSTNNIGGLNQYAITTNSGTFSVEDGRLEYSASLGESTRVLRMNDGANTAYNEDWTASLTLSNLAVPASGFNLIGLQVFSSAAEYGFFNVALYRTSGGTTGVLFEKGRTTDGSINTYTFNSYFTAESDMSDVLVRMSHDSATKDFRLGYSLDGGATYEMAATFNPNLNDGSQGAGNWYAAPTNGYSFRILGSNTADPVGGDVMFADNFSVIAGETAMSAIPEPSTYAALAGLGALGLAIWRRRQAKNVA